VAAVHIEIPPRSAYVGVVRLAIASLARAAQFAEDVVEDLKIAVSEACANAVLSMEEARSSGPVSVSWNEEGDRIVIEVGDRGVVHETPTREDVDSQGFSTRLVMSHALLTSLVDEYQFVPGDSGGMVSRLIIARPT
jgi:anti-sigma regulatory factor (Ser/Thr protein kinase)